MQDMIAKAEAGFAINIDEMAAQLKKRHRPSFDRKHAAC